jgi:hypothetical protein
LAEYKNERAIKLEEHKRIVARETHEERKDCYELLWELGGSQSDIACLENDDIDWSDWTICYNCQFAGKTSRGVAGENRPVLG